MKSKFFFFILLLSSISLSTFAQQKPRIAVYMTGNDTINGVITDGIMKQFLDSRQYRVTERSESFLQAISKEQKYQRSGVVDDSEIAAIGKQFAVDYIYVASIITVWNNKKYITGRVLDVNTAEVMASRGRLCANTVQDIRYGFKSLTDTLINNMRVKRNLPKAAVYVVKSNNKEVDIALGNCLVSALADNNTYIAVERTNAFLKQLSKEAAYQQSGAVDDKQLMKIGKQFGAECLFVIRTQKINGLYDVSVKIIDIVTAEVIRMETFSKIVFDRFEEVESFANAIANGMSDDEVVIIPDVNPEFPGGEEKLHEYLAENIRYPDLPRDMGVDAKVFVQFVVEKDGSASNVQAKNIQLTPPSNYETNVEVKNNYLTKQDEMKKLFAAECLRVVNQMPKWYSGKVGGRRVRSQFILPINFNLK